MLSQEFELLHYSLSSARIFFRADKTASDEREDSQPHTDQGDDVHRQAEQRNQFSFLCVF